MSKDDVTKRFKPVWNLPLVLERNIDHKGMEKLQELYNTLGEVLDHPHRCPHKWRRPILHDDGSLTFLGKPVTLHSYTSFLGEYEWWLTQEIKRGKPTRAKVQHKRATSKVFSHSCTTVASAVYMCIIEHKRRGGLIELPERYADQWLGWTI